ncbi:transcription factor MYB124-like [Phragmites australis]|uniref:transcription factor MYB124-like n=1 Tax=Phragmites australis TaxID=29695 RepID=UPI002D780C7D|nr:transcription factor MYB124-like [Phragmites australis]
MATGPDLSASSSAAPDAATAAAAKKDRHIVSWSDEEDGVLRAQIAIHGTDNWTIIAAQFKDKTARQCRRRWYNYLNSECKKGGWSREEDMLLCEAQKVLGNRWTEIAKVVSGRTDNAVKNRFSTLCKRRVKDEELFQENGAPCSNANAKRILTQTGCLTPGVPGSLLPIKQTRFCNSDSKDNTVPNMRLFGPEKGTQDARQPLAIISSNNQDNVKIVEPHNLVAKTATKQLFGVKHEGNFLNKDDPKVATLLQQADLLSSLATKIKTENTSQSMDEAWQQLQHHLVKKDDSEMSESSMSGIASLLEDLDDLIVDPYENEEEDGQKLREQNGQIDGHDEHCNGPSQTSMELRSHMAPDQKMDDCSVDVIKEDNIVCTNALSGKMEPCLGAEIPASENLSEVAEDSKLQCMESTSPVVTDFDDLIIDPYESKEEDEQKLREQNEQIDLHDGHSNGPSQTSMELTSGMAPDQKMEDCPVDNCKEDNSLCRSVLSGSTEPCPATEISASEYLGVVAEDSRLQSMESTSPVLTNFQSKECAEIPASENLSEVAEDGRLQCIEFTSPAHTVSQAKAGAEIPASPKFSGVGKDSKLPSVAFTSPAHTVPTFQPYADDMPTPKFTASERNFLLSVLGLTSPGSKPETSQQPSCKRALLNSL